MWPAERGVYLVVGGSAVEAGRVIDGRWVQDGFVTAPIESTPRAALDALVWPTPASGASSRTNELRVLVADRWLQTGTLLWSDALLDEARGEAEARAQLSDAGFELGVGGCLRIDAAPYGQPRAAVNHPAEIVDALRAWAQRANLDLRSVLSLGTAAWYALARPAAAVIHGDGGVTVMRATRAALHDTQVRVGDSDWRSHWQRLQLRDPLLAANSEPVTMDLDAREDAGVPQALALARRQRHLRSPLDVVQASRSPLLGWAVAAGFAACAMAIAWQGLDARARTSEGRAAVQAQRPAQPPRAAPPLSKQDLLRIAGVNAAIRELNLPIDAVLSALDPPRELRVALLSMDATGPGSVRITAETRTSAEMARYVAFVGDRAPFTRATITQHERDMALPEKPYRFSMEASWND